MSTVSCQQKIILNHKFYNIEGITVSPSSAMSIIEAIVYVFFVANNRLGLSDAQILFHMGTLFPEYSTGQITTAIELMTRQGVLTVLQPICRDWCADECPPRTYAISPRLDMIPSNDYLTLYLVQLAGGTRSISRVFRQWFANVPNPQAPLAGKSTSFGGPCNT